MVFAPESVGGARDLDQTLGGLRFCRLTTQLRPVNPASWCSWSLSGDKKMRSKAHPRSLVFTHWILYRSRRACHGQRDQSQREANAESFLIDPGIGEASTRS